MDPKRAASKPAKVRKNVMLSKKAIARGKKLARLDRRSSFSNMLESLLSKEYARQFPEKAVAAEAA